jgi:hypothetical protein
MRVMVKSRRGVVPARLLAALVGVDDAPALARSLARQDEAAARRLVSVGAPDWARQLAELLTDRASGWRFAAGDCEGR